MACVSLETLSSGVSDALPSGALSSNTLFSGISGALSSNALSSCGTPFPGVSDALLSGHAQSSGFAISSGHALSSNISNTLLSSASASYASGVSNDLLADTSEARNTGISDVLSSGESEVTTAISASGGPGTCISDAPAADTSAFTSGLSDALISGPSNALNIPSDIAPNSRPNASLLFTGADALESPNKLPPIPLRSSSIRHSLRDYPDQSFVDLLCDIATHGARIGYEGPNVCVRRANHRSAYENSDAVSKAIQTELDNGHLPILEALPNDRYYCSPIGVIPKKLDGQQAGESSSTSPVPQVAQSMMVSRENMAASSMSLSNARLRWWQKQGREQS